MAVNLSPIGGVAAQFFDNSGNVLTGGKIYTYAAGTTTDQATYTSSNGVTFHSNPIILDASGRVPSGEIWLADNVAYKFVVEDSNNVLIGTYDNIVGINSNFLNFYTQEEIQTATAGQTVFTLSTVSYSPGTNSLSVFVDGVNQYDGSSYAYVETDSTTVTFTAGLHVGALVKFTTAVTLTGGATNASSVIYNPAGIGAVSTTVQTKLREYVSVQDFGAVGDGVANDTSAIQAAITASNGKSLYFPAGTYKVTSKTTFSSLVGTTIFGDRLKSIITAPTLIGLWAFDTSCSNLTIDGITFAGITTDMSVQTVALETNAPYSTITNCYFHDFSIGLNVRSEITNYCNYNNNIFEDIIGNASGYGYALYNLGQYVNIQGNTFINVGRHDIYLSGSYVSPSVPQGSQYVTVANNISYNNGAEAIALFATSSEGAVKGVIVTGNIIYNPTTTAIGLDQNTIDCVVTNNAIFGKSDSSLTYGIYLNGSTTANTYPTRNIISNNFISNASTRGINCINAISNTINGNTIVGEDFVIPRGIDVNSTGTPSTYPTGNYVSNNKTVNCTTSVYVADTPAGIPMAVNIPQFSNTWFAVTAGSTTVDVSIGATSAGRNFKITNSTPTTITNFTNGLDGQEITLYFADANTTINRANCFLAGGVNYTSGATYTLTLVKQGVYWYEKSRSNNG